MEISLPGDVELKLVQMAEQQGRDAGSLVIEAVERMIEYQDWFQREVEAGLEQIGSGQTLSHEEVGLRLKERLAKKQHA
jgi:predicted transcriptional regulator